MTSDGTGVAHSRSIVFFIRVFGNGIAGEAGEEDLSEGT